MSIDRTYREVCAKCPVSTQEQVNCLPQYLGLSKNSEGGFDDMVQLDLNRNLPKYVSSKTTNGIDERYLKAHQIGLIFGILADRIADDQVRKASRLFEARSFFLEKWVDALSDAIGDRKKARKAIAMALVTWRKGVRDEKDAIRLGKLKPDTYARFALDKLSWGLTVSRLCLERHAKQHTKEAFEAAMGLYLCASQCIDDAADTTEDQENRHFDVPSLLGVSPKALFWAAPPLLETATSVARRGGLRHMATWLSEHRQNLENDHQAALSPRETFDSMIIASAVEDRIDCLNNKKEQHHELGNI